MNKYLGFSCKFLFHDNLIHFNIMAISTKEYMTGIMRLNCDYNKQLSDLTDKYISQIDKPSVYSFIEFESISGIMNFFNDKVYEPIKTLYKLIEDGDYLSEKIIIESPGLESTLVDTNLVDHNKKKHLPKVKSNLKIPKCKKGQNKNKYIKLKVWKSFNSYVVTKINRALKTSRKDLLLSRKFKLFNRIQTKSFSSLVTTLKQALLFLLDKHSVILNILSLDNCRIQKLLNTPLNTIYKEFNNSAKYTDRRRFMKSRLGMVNMRIKPRVEYNLN